MTAALRKRQTGHPPYQTEPTWGSIIMNISFTGKTFRSVGDLFFQAVVDGKVLSCFVTSEALSLCDCAHQKVSAEEIYRNYRDWIEQAASDLIRAGALAPVIVRGRDLAASRASLPHGGVPAYDLDRARQLRLVPRSSR
nr:hypothetical protein RSP673_19625 [Ralstonia solanacearum P673]